VPSEISQPEIQRWVDLLRSGLSRYRLEGEESVLPTRGAIRTGGGKSKSASPRRSSLTLFQVIEELKHEEPEVRRAVMFACGQLEDDRALEVLQRFLESDVVDDIRCEAVDALGKIGGTGAEDLLKQVAREDSKPHVQVRAVRALDNLGKLKAKARAAK